MNSSRAGFLAAAALACLAPLAQAAEKQDVQQPQATTVPAETTVATPQIQILPPELSAFYASIAAHNRVRVLANGARSMDFEGGMILVAKLDDAGKMESACVTTEAAARRFLGTKAPLARAAEDK